MSETTNEKQTCGRRMGDFGPWEHAEGLDEWETNRWSLDFAAVDARHEAEAKRVAEESQGRSTIYYSPVGDKWVWDGPIPRTCSFCGGVHPDDAFRLIEAGWEIEIAKSYKFYLNPPGYHAHLTNFRIGEKSDYHSPVPPVKGYSHHFTKEQTDRLNLLYREQKTKRMLAEMDAQKAASESEA